LTVPQRVIDIAFAFYVRAQCTQRINERFGAR
jgi:hypothetical protein